MPVIKGNIGFGVDNDPLDVAKAKAMFTVAKPPHHRGSPVVDYWNTGNDPVESPIDGEARPSFKHAVQQFVWDCTRLTKRKTHAPHFSKFPGVMTPGSHSAMTLERQAPSWVKDLKRVKDAEAYYIPRPVGDGRVWLPALEEGDSIRAQISQTLHALHQQGIGFSAPVDGRVFNADGELLLRSATVQFLDPFKAAPSVNGHITNRTLMGLISAGLFGGLKGALGAHTIIFGADGETAISGKSGKDELQDSDDFYGKTGIRSFGGKRPGSLIETENSGKRFKKLDSAFWAADKDIQNLVRKFYPQASKTTIAEFGKFIPEVGVEIIEFVENGRVDHYFFQGVIVGTKLPNGNGEVGWTISDIVAGRAHYHWTSIRPSKPDIENANMFYKRRKGKIYREWIGAYGGWRLFFKDGKQY